MAGYAIQARVVGDRPRLSAPAPRGLDEDDWPAPEVGQQTEDALAVPLDELTPTRSERRERGRELWSQTTFFLFDPNSWR